MSYTGKVEKGVVVFDGPTRPADGTTVRIEETGGGATEGPRVGEGLDRLAGKAQGLPEDLAERHDEYRRERRST